MSDPKTLRDLLSNRGVRIIQYGESSVGKTVRAATAVRWGRVQLHDFDDKAQNLAAYLAKNDPAALDLIEIVSYSDAKGDSKKGEKFFTCLSELKKNPRKVCTLVIDSLTRFEEIYHNYLMEKITSSGTGFGSARVLSEIGGEAFTLPGTNDYSILNSAMKKLMGWLKDLNINVILNAHVQEPVETRNVVSKPGTVAAKGKVKSFLPTEFTEFHRLFVDKYGKHRVQVKSTEQYLASTSLTEVPSNGILMDTSLRVFDAVAIKDPAFATETTGSSGQASPK